MKKIIIALAGFCLGLGILIAFIKPSTHPLPETNKKNIKIGVSLPLTGDLATLGLTIRNALALFEKDLKGKDLKNNYEFIVEDNVYDTKKIISINSKFMGYDNVDAIIDYGSKPGIITTGAAKGKTLHFNICASDQTVGDGEYNFLHTTRSLDEATTLINELSEKYKNVLIVYVNEAGYAETAGAMIEMGKNKGLNVESIILNPTERNMKDVAAMAANKKPDVYILGLRSPLLETFLKSLREKDTQTPVSSTHAITTINDYNLVDGMDFVSYGLANEALEKRFIAETKGESTLICMGNAYDVASILIDAFEKTNTAEEARTYIANIKEWDSETMDTKIPVQNGVFAVPAVKVKIKNGQIIRR